MRERGVSYSTSPTGEMGRPASAGVIQLGELLEAGVKMSISIDNTSSYACRLFPVHAHPLSPAHASHRRAHSARLQAPGAARDARRRDRSRHRGPHRLAHAGQARRSHPRAHRRHQRRADERSLSGARLVRAAGQHRHWSSSTAASCAEAARSPRSTTARSSGKPPSARRRCARGRTGRDDVIFSFLANSSSRMTNTGDLRDTILTER